MKIRAKVVPAKTEYHRKRNKCLCCTRLNKREELYRRYGVKEAIEEIEND